MAADRELLLSQIDGQLLSLESIRSWETNPNSYITGAADAIFSIMSRTFAPPPERRRSVIAREKLIGRLLQSSRENLANPPHVYTELALEQLPGVVGFFQNDVLLLSRVLTTRHSWQSSGTRTSLLSMC